MPEAQEVRRSETGGILLRLKSGREEWFPLKHVVHTEQGWFMKQWLYEERTGAGKRVDTTNMKPRARRRAGSADTGLVLFTVFLGISLLWCGVLEVACRSREVPSDRATTAAVVAAFPPSLE